MTIQADTPVRTETKIPVPYLDLAAQMRPIRKEIDAAIARTLDNCSFCLGPDVAQFEKDFARFIGAEHCVCFNSGTSALHVAMLLLNIGAGDEVIVPAMTFCATANAVIHSGAIPILVDVERDSQLISLDAIQRAIHGSGCYLIW